MFFLSLKTHHCFMKVLQFMFISWGDVLVRMPMARIKII